MDIGQVPDIADLVRFAIETPEGRLVLSVLAGAGISFIEGCREVNNTIRNSKYNISRASLHERYGSLNMLYTGPATSIQAAGQYLLSLITETPLEPGEILVQGIGAMFGQIIGRHSAINTYGWLLMKDDERREGNITGRTFVTDYSDRPGPHHLGVNIRFRGGEKKKEKPEEEKKDN